MAEIDRVGISPQQFKRPARNPACYREIGDEPQGQIDRQECRAVNHPEPAENHGSSEPEEYNRGALSQLAIIREVEKTSKEKDRRLGQEVEIQVILDDGGARGAV